MKTPLDRKQREALLQEARDRCFFIDLDDAAARLCRANMAFGIAKILWMQRELGMDPDCAWISTPDSTVTRNLDRWASGFGYGGAVIWSGDLIPLELKPNFCGMSVVGLTRKPPVLRIMETVVRLSETTVEVEGVQAHWDMHRGNHFINLYEVDDAEATSGCPYVAIMHSSGSELRAPNELGPGLYPGRTGDRPGLLEMAETMDTPFGEALYLTGTSASDFLEYCATVERFTRLRRETYARLMFGKRAKILFNRMHQGLVPGHRMLLGCYHVSGEDVPWVPVTLQPELPAYLIRPERIYSPQTLENEGMLERAKASGLLDVLTDANLLPHGGGYTYPEIDGTEIEVDDRGPAKRRRFRARGGEWFEDARSLPFAYRGEEVVRRIEALGAGRVAARLTLLERLEG